MVPDLILNIAVFVIDVAAIVVFTISVLVGLEAIEGLIPKGQIPEGTNAADVGNAVKGLYSAFAFGFWIILAIMTCECTI